MSVSALRPDLAQARRLLRRHWGHDGFRRHQRPVVAAMLAGRDVLAVLPTGGGKSVCFQLPALTAEGLTVVVSPLISLMEDQVAGARRRGLPAAALTSSTPPPERRRTLAGIRSGTVRLLYLAPERLGSATLLERLRVAGVGRVAVDEAHCVSEWGHDFRPAYRRIGAAVEALGGPPLAAFTATATPRTRRDLGRSLGLRDPVEVVAGVDRSNLRWLASRRRRRSEAGRTVLEALRNTRGAAIVYLPTRRRAAGMAEVCRRSGVDALPYHAGLPAGARSEIQEKFLAGKTRVVCGTSAFGMGIDHESVRLVAHVGAPGSLEAYVQEAGRAGRDGDPALCLLASHRGDLALQRDFARRAWPRTSLVRAAWWAMDAGEPIRLPELRERLGRGLLARPPGRGEVTSALRILVQQGAARERTAPRGATPLPATSAGDPGGGPPGGRDAGLPPDPGRGGVGAEGTAVPYGPDPRREPAWVRGPDVLLRRVDLGAVRRGRRRARRRRRAVKRYLRTRRCRRRVVARWFGQRPPRCAGCDRCGGVGEG